MKENIFEAILISEARKPLTMVKYSDVLIDVDSCLSTIEGIDELGRMRGCNGEISELTRLAMEGHIPLEDIFRRRLEIIQPRDEDLIQLSGLYMINLTPGSLRTIEILQEQNINVHLISGGYENAMIMLAKFLGIPMENVYANKLFFKDYKEYIGFDEKIPLWKRGGKKKAIQDLKSTGKLGKRIAIVGDGVSELETLGDTDLFIGFGAHARREIVEENSDIFITEPNMAILLPFLIDPEGLYQIATNESDRELLSGSFAALDSTRFNLRACDLKQEIEVIERNLAMMYR